ncbi:hypothetical protein ACLOJK_012247 [Asimina triloba]
MAANVAKVRVVRCPKCWQLLREPNIPVYQCGGSKRPGESSRSRTAEANQEQNNEVAQASNGRESIFMSQQLAVCATDACTSDVEHPACERSGNGDDRGPNVPPSSEFDQFDNESIVLSQQLAVCTTDACTSAAEHSLQCERSGNGDDRGPNVLPSSSEFDQCDNESIISSQQQAGCATDAHNSDVQHPVECETSGNGDDRRADVLPSSREFDQCDREHSPTTAVQREESSGSKMEGSNYQSPVSEEKSNESEERHSEVESAMAPNCSIQSKASHSSALQGHEKISQPPAHHSCDTTSPRDEMEGGGLPIHQKSFSEDTVDTKLSGAVGDLSKSPTRSSHAYDASISSYGDILDEHVVIGHQNQSSKSLLKLPSTRFRSNGEVIHTKGKTVVDSEMQIYKTDVSSKPLNDYGFANGESSNWNHDHPSRAARNRSPAPPEQGSVQEADVFHSVKSWMESERDGSHQYPLSRDSSYQWDPRSTCENGGPSNYRHEQLVTSPNSYASDKLDYLEKDRLELLKKVEELRDHLSRSFQQRGKGEEKVPIRSSPQVNQWLLSYDPDHLSHEPLPHNNMSYLPSHHQPYIPRKTMLHQYGLPQTPFSRQPTSCQLHYDHAYPHCCCEGRQLPPHSPATDYSRTGPAQQPQLFPRYSSFYSSSSTPSQPKLHKEPAGFSQDYRIPYPHDQRRLVTREIEKLQHKERRQAVKRLCLPVADGAPFIICNRCWKVLQLPADFLLSRKRRHKLLCGHCSKILTFSLRRNNCSASSSSHMDGILRADPVSYSDDYGVSISKSYSTEREPISFASSVHYNRSGWNDKKLRGSSSIKQQADERRTRVISEQSDEQPEDPNESPPSEGSLDVNRASSPLHRLMGYSSNIQRLLHATLHSSKMTSQPRAQATISTFLDQAFSELASSPLMGRLGMI